MPLVDALLTHGDYYMHLADLKSYLDADEKVREITMPGRMSGRSLPY